MFNHTLYPITSDKNTLPFHLSYFVDKRRSISPPFHFPDVQQESDRIPFRLDHAPCFLLLLSLAGCDCVRVCVSLVCDEPRSLAYLEEVI